MIKLVLREIKDFYIRENFKILENYLRTQNNFNFTYKFYELSFPKDGAIKVPHNLNFTPKDVQILSYRGTGSYTIDYEDFDATNVVFTISGTKDDNPLTIRALIGTYKEGTGINA